MSWRHENERNLLYNQDQSSGLLHLPAESDLNIFFSNTAANYHAILDHKRETSEAFGIDFIFEAAMQNFRSFPKYCLRVFLCK